MPTRKTPRRKAAAISTSQARANFANALERAQTDNAIIAFERYGKPIAALAPIDAVRLLAGERVAPAAQKAIVEAARAIVRTLPAQVARTKSAPKRGGKR